jgi:hypothetical protein
MNAVPTDPIEYAKSVEKIKNIVNRWPSAYASGLVVKDYKNKMTLKNKPPYKENIPKNKTSLTRWFAEKWIDITTNKACGSVHNKNYYPTCRPSIHVNKNTPITSKEISPKQKKKIVKDKQKAKDKHITWNL